MDNVKLSENPENDKEIWEDIKGYDGWYQISSHSRVRSCAREDAIILKQQRNTNGYYHVYLSHNKKVYTLLIHRLVAEAFISNPLSKPYINHKNGRKYDNRLKNLEWVTASENTIHAYKAGLKKSSDHQKEQVSLAIRGSRCHTAKLVEDDIIKIRQLYKDGMQQKEIAKIYGCNPPAISCIITGKTWKHVKNEGKYIRTRNSSK